MKHYKLSFRGECLEGRAPEQVAAALQVTFGLSAEKAAELFDGRMTTIKKAVSADVAQRYLQAFKTAGGLLVVQGLDPAEQNILEVPVRDQAPAEASARVISSGNKRLLLVAAVVVVTLLGAVLSQLGAPDSLLAGLTGPERPAHFVGTWSNKKGEFQTINVGLRSDGRGFFAGATFPLLARWEASEQGVHIKATMPMEDSFGQFIEYDLEYNQKHNLLLFKTKTGIETLYKIEETEPVDLEAKLEQSLIEEQQRRKKDEPTRVVPVSDQAELISKLPELVRVKTQVPTVVQISSQNAGWELRVGNFSPETSVHLSISVLDRGVDSPSAIIRKTTYRDETIPELPVRYQMPDAARHQLEGWLDQHGYQHSEMVALGKSIWEIEEHQVIVTVGPVKNLDAVAKIVEFLLQVTFSGDDDYQVLSNEGIKEG